MRGYYFFLCRAIAVLKLSMRWGNSGLLNCKQLEVFGEQALAGRLDGKSAQTKRSPVRRIMTRKFAGGCGNVTDLSWASLHTLAQDIVEPHRETYKGPEDQSCLSLGETGLPYPKGSCGVKTEAVVYLFPSGLEPRWWSLTSGAVFGVGAELWVTVEPHMACMVSDLLPRLKEKRLH
jgi:hypothetical protein